MAKLSEGAKSLPPCDAAETPPKTAQSSLLLQSKATKNRRVCIPGTVRLRKEISSQACFDEPLVVVVLADDADLVGDEVCAVEADAEPPDGTGQVTASGWEAGRAIRSARAGGGSATQRLALARLQGLHSPSKTRRILLRPERLSMKTVASQKLANHGDVATGRHGLPRLVLVL